MIRGFMAATILVMTVSTATAVAGYDGSGGQPHIMGSSTPETTAAATSGKGYTAKVSMVNRTMSLEEEEVSNVRFRSGNRVFFKGYITAPTPCHTLEHDVEKKAGNSYVIDISTVDPQEGGACAQALTSISYDASFEAGEPYRLKVRHNGKQIDTLEHPDHVPGKERRDSSGFLRNLARWLGNLF